MIKPTNEYKELLSGLTFEALLLSENGICIAQNEKARKMFGYSDTKAIGKSLIDWIHPLDRELVVLKIKGKEEKPYEVIAQRSDGSYFPCEIQAKNFPFKGKEIRVTSLRDISTRKTIEKELYDRISELEIITTSIPNAIWKANFDENGETIDTYISDSINSLLELPPGTIKNDWDKFYSYLLPGELEGIKQKIVEAVENPGKIVTHAYQVKKGNGEIAWLSSSGRVTKTGTGAVGYGFSYDISELKEHEQALIELNTTKDKLFSIISHDLKNPFTAFMGFSELMIKQIDSGKFENLSKYAEAILLGARQGSELLSNLLDWSRAQREKLSFNPELIETEKFIKNISNYFIQPLKSKEIELIYENEEVESFIGDRMMLETIIRNLLSNAIKFSKRNGKIALKVYSNSLNTFFSVEDEGVGISEDRQQSLFDLNNSYTTNGTENEKGTGLGLILCKEFVELHEGEIYLESKPMKGTKIWFSIPRK